MVSSKIYKLTLGIALALAIPFASSSSFISNEHHEHQEKVNTTTSESNVATLNENEHTSHDDGWIAISSSNVVDTTYTISISGSYYLSEDITADVTIESGLDVTLCLNGNVLTGSGTTSVIYVNQNASLTICDCLDGTEGIENLVDGYTYNSGVITGGSATRGGGINVQTGSSLTLTGGSIVENSATTNGGGVYVTGGTLNLEGGLIANNTSGNYGGGVGLNSSNATIYDGVITNNTGTNGGGVYTQSSNFLLIGGQISNNSSTYGGGAYFNISSTITINGGEIINNVSSSIGGGFYAYSSTEVTIDGGTIANASNDSLLTINESTLNINDGFINDSISNLNESIITINGGYFGSNAYSSVSGFLSDEYFLVYTGTYEDYPFELATSDYFDGAEEHENHDGNWVAITQDDIVDNTFTIISSGLYYLSEDINGDIFINEYSNVYLCLNGKVLTGSGTTSVITVSQYSSLYLCDCLEGQVTNIVQGDEYNSGVITNGNAVSISSNVNGAGGGIYFADNTSLTIAGGTIAHNQAVRGGALGTTADTTDSVTLNIIGGQIVDNESSNNGGAIFMMQGTANISNTVIANNNSDYYGGAIACNYTNVYINENVTIYNNKACQGENLFTTYDSDSIYITSTGALLDISAGYIEGSIYSNVTDIYIHGGYLAESTYNSLNSSWLQDSDGNTYSAIDISLDENNYGDSGYIEGYPYGIYLIGELPEYSVTDIVVSCNDASDYEDQLVVHNNDYLVNVTYSYFVGLNLYDGLPSEPGTYEVRATFDEYIDGANKTYYESLRVTFNVTIEEHQYTSYVEVEGGHVAVCEVCNETSSEVLDHTWSEWTTTKEATADEEGEEERSCTVCGATETATIDKYVIEESNNYAGIIAAIANGALIIIAIVIVVVTEVLDRKSSQK